MNIPWTLGAYELGVLFATVLYGIVIAQTFTYTQEKFKDPIWLKALVCLSFNFIILKIYSHDHINRRLESFGGSIRSREQTFGH